jgi:hypothetical protein
MLDPYPQNTVAALRHPQTLTRTLSISHFLLSLSLPPRALSPPIGHHRLLSRAPFSPLLSPLHSSWLPVWQLPWTPLPSSQCGAGGAAHGGSARGPLAPPPDPTNLLLSRPPPGGAWRQRTGRQRVAAHPWPPPGCARGTRGGPTSPTSWQRTATRGGSAQRRRVEAAVGGAWRRLSSPAPVSGRPASHRDPIAFSIFVLDLVAFSFLFRDLIGPMYKFFDSQVR